jgi:phosphomannomutase
VDHLAARGEIARGLAISVAAGSLAARAAAAHGVRVVRVGLGFAPLSAALRAGSADIAGEESGGFAWRALGLGKDATLAAGLALEAAAREPLHARVARLERDHGSAACGRTALPATSRARAALARLAAAPPEHIGRARVVRCARDEGVRCELADGFVHWRASGTEPVIRIYAEARTHAGLRRRLAFGAARLR